MSQHDPWRTRGPVRTLRTEFAEWDLTNDHWQASRHITLVQFRPDGSISESETQNPNGSVSTSRYVYDEVGRLLEVQFQLDDGPVSKTHHRYDDSGRPAGSATLQSDGTEIESSAWEYDENGRKTKVQSVARVESGSAMAFSIEGSDQHYHAEGVVEIRTHYNDREQPSEALFYDKNGALVLRVDCARDAAGRLVTEESRCGDKLPFDRAFADVPAEDRAAVSQTLALLFGPQNVMFRTTYLYDDIGRQLERHRFMGALGEVRTTWHYDEHDNVTLEVEEDVSREMHLDESGNLRPTQEKSSRREVQSDYKYDLEGNWTERVVSIRYEVNPEFQRSNIVRREITYW